MKKAVIFDFDGVIADSEGMHLQAFNAAARQAGFPEQTLPTMHDYAGSADADAYARLCLRVGRGVDPDAFASFIALKWERAATLIGEGHVRAYPGTVRLIHAARDRAAIAVCSGARRREIDLMLEALGLAGVFRTIVSADDVPKAKPDPAGYVLTVRRLGLTPRDCVVIEDTDKGIAAAKEAGLKVVAVAHTLQRERLIAADVVMDSTDGLTVVALLA
ncbi:MAG: HAD family phosphatase [Phycisphaerae bacterium]|nr:HAD family phosphatase [Phycisphaerae bacterium]